MKAVWCVAYDAGDAAEALGVGGSFGRSDPAGGIDHRCGALRNNCRRMLQGSVAQLGVTDGVDYQGMRRQGRGSRVEVGIDRCDGEDPVVDPGPGGDVAAAGGDQQQQGHAGCGAAIALYHDGTFGEAGLPMHVRGRIAKLGQHPGEALMRLGTGGVGGERGSVVLAGAGEFTILGQHIAEGDVPDRVGRMVVHRLGEGAAGGGAMTAGEGERAEFLPCGEAGRVQAQRLEVGLLRRFVVAACDVRAGTLQCCMVRAVRDVAGCLGQRRITSGGSRRFWKYSRWWPGGKLSSTPNTVKPSFA